MRRVQKPFFLVLQVLLICSLLPHRAKGADSAVGLALLHVSGARPSALGDAFTAVTNDIRALEFNPASLGTLQNGHASLLYQSGLSDDAFSKASLGLRLFNGAAGVSAGHYDSGKIQLFDGVSAPHSVIAEDDWVVNLGYGGPMGKATWGTKLQYFSSRLAETYSDTAVTIDAGLNYPIRKNLRLGLSGPLVQTKFQYADREEKLPRVYRVGLLSEVNLKLATGLHPITLLFDAPYDTNTEQIFFAGGIESNIGPMTLRTGYNGGNDLNNFTFGAGFTFSRFAIDYAFGLVESGFDSVHNVSFSMRFGNEPSTVLSQIPPGKSREVYLIEENVDGKTISQMDPSDPRYTQFKSEYFTTVEKISRASGRTYFVKKGDTLNSIAKEMYGDERWGSLIYYDNKDKIKDPAALPEGLKLTLP